MGKPTLDMYAFAQAAFDHFNRELFAGELPAPLFTFQRDKRIFGYFSPQRWQRSDGEHAHEIALNPMYFITHKPLELMQTIVHEMCHLWQHEFGTPSRTCYHNREWADKMKRIGLMPSDTGEPGGKKVGQQMSDYPIPGGRFYQACVGFAASGYSLPFVDTHHPGPNASSQIRQVSDALMEELVATANAPPLDVSAVQEAEGGFSAFEGDAEVAAHAAALLQQPFSEHFDLPTSHDGTADYQAMAAKKAKVCYRCPGCGIKLWGKPQLLVICGECEVALETV